jgi:hypothetical protein
MSLLSSSSYPQCKYILYVAQSMFLDFGYQ